MSQKVEVIDHKIIHSLLISLFVSHPTNFSLQE